MTLLRETDAWGSREAFETNSCQMSLLDLTASEMTFWQKRNNQIKKVKTFIIAECSEFRSQTSHPEQCVTLVPVSLEGDGGEWGRGLTGSRCCPMQSALSCHK